MTYISLLMYLFYFRIFTYRLFNTSDNMASNYRMITKFDLEGAEGMHRGIPASAQTNKNHEKPMSD